MQLSCFGTDWWRDVWKEEVSSWMTLAYWCWHTWNNLLSCPNWTRGGSDWSLYACVHAVLWFTREIGYSVWALMSCVSVSDQRSTWCDAYLCIESLWIRWGANLWPNCCRKSGLKVVHVVMNCFWKCLVSGCKLYICSVIKQLKAVASSKCSSVMWCGPRIINWSST